MNRTKVEIALSDNSRAIVIDPNLMLAVEFGYKCCEKGMNIEMARAEFAKEMEGDR